MASAKSQQTSSVSSMSSRLPVFTDITLCRLGPILTFLSSLVFFSNFLMWSYVRESCAALWSRDGFTLDARLVSISLAICFKS